MNTDASSSRDAPEPPLEGLGGDENSSAFPYHPLVTDVEAPMEIAREEVPDEVRAAIGKLESSDFAGLCSRKCSLLVSKQFRLDKVRRQ